MNTLLKKFPVVNHEILEIIVGAGATASRFNLPDAQNLRNVKIMNVEIFSVDDVSKSPQGNPLPSAAQLSASYLTLQGYTGKEFLHQAPMQSFHYMTTGANTYERYNKQFTNQRVNYPKSYIEYFGPVPVTQFSFLISVYYVNDQNIEAADRKADFSHKN